MAQNILQQARADGFLVAVIDGYSIVLDREQAIYEVSFNGWRIATTTTFYGAVRKIEQCQAELRSIAPWIRAMEAAP